MNVGTKKIRKGTFVKLTMPLRVYPTLENDTRMMPNDAVYYVTYAGKIGQPDSVRVYHRDLCYSRTIPIKNCIVVEGPKKPVNVGDIFVSTGGYDQTNVAFYKVKKVSKSILQVVEIGAKRVHEGFMTGHATPNPNLEKNMIYKVRICYDCEGNPSFKVPLWGYAFPTHVDASHFFSEWH